MEKWGRLKCSTTYLKLDPTLRAHNYHGVLLLDGDQCLHLVIYLFNNFIIDLFVFVSDN